MNFNAKQTHQLIHKNIQYALQAAQEQEDKKYDVQLGPINSQNKRQLWLLQGNKGGSFQIVNGFTDKVLTENGQQLFLKQGAGNKHQSWLFQFVSDNEFLIKLAKSKQSYLCVQGGRLIFRQCKAPFNPDVWILKAVVDNPSLNKSCFIMSTDTKKLIDVPEANTKQGSNILIYDPNYRYNQRWNIFRAGQIFVIKSFFNQMNLDVFQQKFDHHTPIVQWPSHGQINQFWMLQKVEQSVYRISTFFDKELELGHYHGKLALNKGRKYTWLIEGYVPG